MNTKSLLAAIFAALSASAFANDQFNGEAIAQAQSAGEWPAVSQATGVPNVVSSKSRAEVLADLQIWRESGMAALQDVGDGQHGYIDPRYSAALAKYQELRASPRFAELVEKFSRKHG